MPTMPLKTSLKHFPSHYDCPEPAEILLPFLSYQDCKLKTETFYYTLVARTVQSGYLITSLSLQHLAKRRMSL